MKTQLYKVVLFLLLIPTIGFANDGKKKHEKSRIIKKSYTVNANATVSIDNRYGNIKVKTWSKNRVEIEVKITVKGNNLDFVERKLSTIDVDFNASTNFVSAKTIFGSSKSNWSWWRKSSNVNYQIDYLVRMPESNNIDLDNDYGNIYLDKLNGEADINCDYGKIIIGELLNKQNNINLDYCSSSNISYIKSGNINIDYSKLSVEKSDRIRVNADYSTLQFTEINTLNFNTDYGSVTVDEANSITGNTDYTSMRFGTIKKSLKIDADYGSIRIKNLENGFDFIDIDSQYTGIRIGVAPNNNFNFIIDLQYASFKRDSDNVDIYKSIEKNSKKHYEGFYGKEKTSSKVIIKSQYGSVSIKENY